MIKMGYTIAVSLIIHKINMIASFPTTIDNSVTTKIFCYFFSNCINILLYMRRDDDYWFWFWRIYNTNSFQLYHDNSPTNILVNNKSSVKVYIHRMFTFFLWAV